jgi:Cdc6-like AAA superfamily ATPase
VEDDPNEIYVIFQGYRYDLLPQPNYSKISRFLHHIEHVIAADDKIVHRYVMCWFAKILQNPTYKNEVLLLIQGKQGGGKTNAFTDIISHLLGDYALPNITDASNIIGHFNSMIEDKKLIVLNELVSSDENTAHIDYNNFKSPISDRTIDITAKGRDTREVQNILNIIITTNYINALRFNGDDRRICPITTNNEYSRVKDDDPEFQAREVKRSEYFDPLFDEVAEREFYPTLFTYFMNYDTTGFNPRKFPITQARTDIIEANKSPIEIFMEEHIAEFQSGIITDNAYQLYRELCVQNGNRGVFSKQKFLGELKPWADNKKDTKADTYGKRHFRLYLNQVGTKHFRKAIAELADDAGI